MMSGVESGDVLEGRVLRYIEDPSADVFEDLALAVFRRQWRDNEPYRRICDVRGIDPDRITDWREIPAVSTAAFKVLRLATGPSSIVFRTSGTTRGRERRGEHHLPHTRVYEAALRRHFKNCVLPDVDQIRMIAIAPCPTWAPESSLGFMVADVMKQFGAPGSGQFMDPAGLRTDDLVRALRDCERREEPVLILGTTLAFVHFLENVAASGTTFRLPARSRIMDTGGFKGETRSWPREELLHRYGANLGISKEWVVNEYGMTELGSQFYTGFALTGGDERFYAGPHWVRTLIIDPATGKEAGERVRCFQSSTEVRAGLLRHIDLANVHSVMAVETEDLAEIPYWSHGREGFILTGRTPSSEPRGCSIADDERLSGLHDEF